MRKFKKPITWRQFNRKVNQSISESEQKNKSMTVESKNSDLATIIKQLQSISIDAKNDKIGTTEPKFKWGDIVQWDVYGGILQVKVEDYLGYDDYLQDHKYHVRKIDRGSRTTANEKSLTLMKEIEKAFGVSIDDIDTLAEEGFLLKDSDSLHNKGAEFAKRIYKKTSKDAQDAKYLIYEAFKKSFNKKFPNRIEGNTIIFDGTVTMETHAYAKKIQDFVEKNNIEHIITPLELIWGHDKQQNTTTTSEKPKTISEVTYTETDKPKEEATNVDAEALTKEKKSIIQVDSSKYDTPKKENRSTKKIPTEVLENIEKNGVTIEEVEALGVPVFIYKTQITLHGNFEGLKAKRGASGYKTLIINGNGTLGVKYVGIDEKKKQLIRQAINIYNYVLENGSDEIQFSFSQDSRGTSIITRLQAKDKDEYIAIRQRLTDKLSELDKSIFVGSANIQAYRLFSTIIVQLEIGLNAIYEKDIFKFISFLTNGVIDSQAKFDAQQEQAIRIKKDQTLKWNEEDKKRDAIRRENEAKQREILIQTASEIEAKGYERYTQQDLDRQKRNSYIEFFTPQNDEVGGVSYRYHFYKIKKAFGKENLRKRVYDSKELLNEKPKEIEIDWSWKSSKTTKIDVDFGIAFKTGFEPKQVPQVQKTVVQNTASPKTVTQNTVSASNLNIQIIDYSEKSIAVFGDTKPLKEELKAIGGAFNFYLNINGKKQAGWIFSKSKRKQVEDLIGANGSVSGIDKDWYMWELPYKEYLQCVKSSSSKDKIIVFDCYGRKLDDFVLTKDKQHPYQIDREKYFIDLHKSIIKYALSKGKEVPKEVLAEYPELIKNNNMTKNNSKLKEVFENLKKISTTKSIGKLPTETSSLSEILEDLKSISTKKKSITEYPLIEDIDNQDETALNHIIEPNDVIVIDGGTETKIDTNMDAILLMNRLKSLNMGANIGQKKTIAKFVGWGGLSNVFKDIWGNEYLIDIAKTIILNKPEVSFSELVDLAYDKYKSNYFIEKSKVRRILALNMMSKEEQKDAIVSTINAFYTRREVISLMWEFISNAGYKGGAVLESSAGIGHFFGLMPLKIRQYSKLFAVEKDRLSGEILKMLYPQANVQIMGFEDANLPLGKFDLVIGNVPFAQKAPLDLSFKDICKFSMHNYFIAKSIIACKAGGVVMVITSNYTMDSGNSDFRIWATDKNGGNADFVGAIRLPSNAFKQTAGTEVTADIVIYKKRVGDIPNPLAHQNINLKTIREATYEKNTLSLMVNEYFELNPQMILGDMKFAFEAQTGGLYSQEERVCEAPENYDLLANLKKAFKLLSDDLNGLFEEVDFNDLLATTTQNTQTITESVGQMIVRDGKIFTVERFSKNGAKELVELDVPSKINIHNTMDVVKDYIVLRTTLKELLKLELES